MGARIWIAGLAMALSVGSTSASAAETESWVIGFDELMSLQPAQRQDYLGELRNIVVEYEVNAEDALPGAGEASFRRLGFLPEAQAATALAMPQNLKCKPKIEYWTRIGSMEFCISKQSDFSNQSAACPRGYSSLEKSALEKASGQFYRGMCYSKSFDPKGGETEIDPDHPLEKCKSPEYQKNGYCEVQSTKCPPSMDAMCVDVAGSSRCTCRLKLDKADKGATDKDKAKPEDPGAACRALVPSCKDRESARAEFFGTNRACVYAGNISRYKGNRPSKGKCEPKSSVTLGQGKTFSCLNGVACNPLVFCVPDVKKSGAYCAKRAMEATGECDRVAPKDPKCLDRLLESKLVPREAWDQFVKDLKQVCTNDKPSASFHCRECAIMYRRVFALNSKHLGNLCAKGAATPPKGKDPTGRPDAAR